MRRILALRRATKHTPQSNWGLKESMRHSMVGCNLTSTGSRT